LPTVKYRFESSSAATIHWRVERLGWCSNKLCSLFEQQQLTPVTWLTQSLQTDSTDIACSGRIANATTSQRSNLNNKTKKIFAPPL